MNSNRVVITGMGVVAPNGVGVGGFYRCPEGWEIRNSAE